MDEKERSTDLRVRRNNLLGKLDSLSQYDVRRPLTPTGTDLWAWSSTRRASNSATSARSSKPQWQAPAEFDDGATPDADLWVTSEEPRDDIVVLHHFAAAHSDATIEDLPPDAAGMVPASPEGPRHVTLHQILVHMVAERAYHLCMRTSCLNSSTASPASVRDPSLTAPPRGVGC